MQRSNGRRRVASELCFDFLAVFEHAAGIVSASETGRRSKKAAGITSGFLLHCLTGLFRFVNRRSLAFGRFHCGLGCCQASNRNASRRTADVV
ncbi:MAG: hypothetical protein ACK56X_05745, partial [Planctomyces sp.]